MQNNNLIKVKILIENSKTNEEKYVPLKDVVLFVDPYKEIRLGDFLNLQQATIDTLSKKVDTLSTSLIQLTDAVSKLNLK